MLLTACCVVAALAEVALLHNPTVQPAADAVVSLLALPPLVVRRRYALEVTLWMMAACWSTPS